MKSDVRDSYNAVCDKWTEFRSHCRVDSCIRRLAENLPEGCRVLDVGCGSGYPISAFLSKCGFEVVGIDISENMIAKARSLDLPNARFLLCDYMKFQSDTPFDAIIAFDSLWHIPYKFQRDIYSKASSLLTDKGYFLFTHGKSDGEINGVMWEHDFYYSALNCSDVVELLNKNLFKIVSIVENYSDPTSGQRDLFIIAQKVVNNIIR